MGFILLLVSSNDDIVVVQTEACFYCTEAKITAKIYRAWPVSQKRALKYKKKKYFTKLHRIRCECEDYKPIKVDEIKKKKKPDKK